MKWKHGKGAHFFKAMGGNPGDKNCNHSVPWCSSPEDVDRKDNPYSPGNLRGDSSQIWNPFS